MNPALVSQGLQGIGDIASALGNMQTPGKVCKSIGLYGKAKRKCKRRLRKGESIQSIARSYGIFVPSDQSDQIVQRAAEDAYQKGKNWTPWIIAGSAVVLLGIGVVAYRYAKKSKPPTPKG